MSGEGEGEAVFVIDDGVVTGVAGGPLSLADLGERRTERLSRVEFNDATNKWEVTDAKGGPVLFSDDNYDVALAWEVRHYNQKLADA